MSNSSLTNTTLTIGGTVAIDSSTRAGYVNSINQNLATNNNVSFNTISGLGYFIDSANTLTGTSINLCNTVFIYGNPGSIKYFKLPAGTSAGQVITIRSYISFHSIIIRGNTYDGSTGSTSNIQSDNSVSGYWKMDYLQDKGCWVALMWDGNRWYTVHYGGNSISYVNAP